MSPQISIPSLDNPYFKDKGIKDPERSGNYIKPPLDDQTEEAVLSRKVLEGVLDKLQKKDTYGVFSEPVDPKQVPDYYEFIKDPMDFGTMRKKIAEGAYASLDLFLKDILLICSNAMCYNARDTIYYKQARAIQDAARRTVEALKAGVPFEIDQKSQGSPAKKLSCKRPPAGKSRFEPTGSDYTSGATLATCGEYGAWMGNEAGKGGKVVNLDRSLGAARNAEVQAFSGWGFSGNVNGLAGSPSDARLDHQDDLSGLLPKLMILKDGKKPQPFEDNRRGSYRPCNPSANSMGPVLAAFGGELQQLFPMGYQQDHAYARSLARFAADLGPAIWKIAAEKICKALPPGVPFGPGWVVEPPPGVLLPILNKEQSHLLSTDNKRLVGSVSQPTPSEAICAPSTTRSESSLSRTAGQHAPPPEQIIQASQLVSKSAQQNQSSTQESMKLSFTGANFASEVSQSKLLEMVSQNGRLVSWTSGKQSERAATSAQSHGSGANHYVGEKMLEGNVSRGISDSAHLICNARPSSNTAGLVFSNHGVNGSSGSQSVWASQSASSQDHCMQNLNILSSGSERQQVLQMNASATPGAPPSAFQSMAATSVVSTVGRDEARMQGWVRAQPMDPRHTGVNARLKSQSQLSSSSSQSQLAGTSHYTAQLQDAQDVLLQQHELQARLAAQQHENLRMSTSVPQFIQHRMPSDAPSYMQQQVVQLHPQGSAKQAAPLGSPGSCDLQDSTRVNLHSQFSAPVSAGSNQFSNQPWRFVPMQYPLQQATNLLSHSLPPDLNVSLPPPKSPLDQASNSLTDPQQPDLALQL